MTRARIERLLSMIATPDTDPDTFEFVVKRLLADFQSALSEWDRDKFRDSSKDYNESR